MYANCRRSVDLRILCCVHRYGAALFQIEGADVVESQNVVGVGVGVQHGVQPVDFFAHRLKTKIRRGIDHHIAAVICQAKSKAACACRADPRNRTRRNGTRAWERPWTCPNPERLIAGKPWSGGMRQKLHSIHLVRGFLEARMTRRARRHPPSPSAPKASTTSPWPSSPSARRPLWKFP